MHKIIMLWISLIFLTSCNVIEHCAEKFPGHILQGVWIFLLTDSDVVLPSPSTLFTINEYGHFTMLNKGESYQNTTEFKFIERRGVNMIYAISTNMEGTFDVYRYTALELRKSVLYTTVFTRDKTDPELSTKAEYIFAGRSR